MNVPSAKNLSAKSVFSSIWGEEGFVEDSEESGEIVTTTGGKRKKIILVCDFCEDEIEEGKVGTMCSKCGVTACESCASDVDFIEHMISEGFIRRTQEERPSSDLGEVTDKGKLEGKISDSTVNTKHGEQKSKSKNLAIEVFKKICKVFGR